MTIASSGTDAHTRLFLGWARARPNNELCLPNCAEACVSSSNSDCKALAVSVAFSNMRSLVAFEWTQASPQSR